jgi:hypothetical protein
LEFANAVNVDSRMAAFVDAIGLGLGDALGLAFAAHIGLESGEDRQHTKTRPSGRCGCVNGLLSDAQVSASGGDFVADVGEVNEAVAKAVEPGDGQGVVRTEDAEKLCKLADGSAPRVEISEKTDI